jgi:hypothetical protein
VLGKLAEVVSVLWIKDPGCNADNGIRLNIAYDPRIRAANKTPG